MFDNVTIARIVLFVFVVLQIAWIIYMSIQIARIAKKSKKRQVILDKMTELNSELSNLVFEEPTTDEREKERTQRILEINQEFNVLSNEFDNIG